ncbi:MAG TPA: dienelactone hydrolase family protein [Caulobacteraceae bacterium]|nr:dienelactone hydrolase family protein [Caulobacteraceae bacterium]
MCEEKDKGLAPYTALTRRRFAALMAAGIGAAGCASTAATPLTAAQRDVSVTTPDGVAEASLFYPEGGRAWPGVLFWPDIGGLRQSMRDMGRRLAASGYAVLVVNPFYRIGNAAATAGVFMDPARRPELRAVMTPANIDRDAAAFVAYLDGLSETSGAKVGVQGYCMGGPLAFRTAAAVPGRIGAVASFHGGGLVTDNADSPHRLIARTNAAYLVAIARNDDEKEPNAKTVLRETFAETGRPAVVEVYDADHGWCVPDSRAYNLPEAERAWVALLDLYRGALV